MVKIANKLDSLGLTKEADVLDRYIQKMAGGVGAAGQKYIDAYGSELSNLAPYDLLLKLKDELSGGWDGTTDSGGMFSSGITKIEAIFYYLFLVMGDGLTYDSIWRDLKNSANYKEGVLTGLQEALDDEETGLTSKCNVARDAGIADYNTANPAPTPTPAPAPTPPSDPWAAYGNDAGRLKAAWKKRTTATKKNPSFDNFKAWLRSRPVDKKDVYAIIQVLLAETTGAAAAGGRLAIPPGAVAESSLPAELRDEIRWSTKKPTGPSPTAQATSPAGSPMTEPAAFSVFKGGPKYLPDFTVPVDRAMKE